MFFLHLPWTPPSWPLNMLEACILQQLQALTNLTSKISAFGLPALMLASIQPDFDTIVYGLVTSFSEPSPHWLPNTTTWPVTQVLISMVNWRPCPWSLPGCPYPNFQPLVICNPAINVIFYSPGKLTSNIGQTFLKYAFITFIIACFPFFSFCSLFSPCLWLIPVFISHCPPF